jgi:hypothetical protein
MFCKVLVEIGLWFFVGVFPHTDASFLRGRDKEPFSLRIDLSKAFVGLCVGCGEYRHRVFRLIVDRLNRTSRFARRFGGPSVAAGSGGRERRPDRRPGAPR